MMNLVIFFYQNIFDKKDCYYLIYLLLIYILRVLLNKLLSEIQFISEKYRYNFRLI